MKTKLGVGRTTPATRWDSYSSFPVDFRPKGTKLPKAIMVNEDGVVTLEDDIGNQVAFTLLGGVVYQLRPSQIISTAIQSGTGPVIALFD